MQLRYKRERTYQHLVENLHPGIKRRALKRQLSAQSTLGGGGSRSNDAYLLNPAVLSVEKLTGDSDEDEYAREPLG